MLVMSSFFFQAEDGIRDLIVTGVQTCALPIFRDRRVVEDHLRVGERVPVWQRALSDHEPGTLRALVEPDHDRGECDRGGKRCGRRLRDELETRVAPGEQGHRLRASPRRPAEGYAEPTLPASESATPRTCW